MDRSLIHDPSPLATEPERMNAPLTDGDLHHAKTSDLAKTLADRLLLLARKEVELARAEAHTELRKGLRFGGLAGGAGLVMVAAMCCGLVAAIFAIGMFWSPIYVALCGMALFAAIGSVVALLAYQRAQDLKPERSLRQAKETLHFVREPLTT